MPTYQFRLRFNLQKGVYINSELEELELFRTQHGQTIRLRGGPRGTPISKSSHAAILGGPYPSAQEAREAATHAREAVVVWAVRQRLGVDFGDGILRTFMTDIGKKRHEEELGHPMRNDRLGIDVYESQEDLRFLSIDIQPALGKPPESFVEQVRGVMSAHMDLSEKQMLSAELYGASFFDESFRSRFITLVTAIEALLEAPPRSGAVQVYLNEAKSNLKTLVADQATLQSIASSLDRMRYDSIGQAGRALTERLLGTREYTGLKAGRFFTHCYGLRSEIVHDGKPADAAVDLLQVSNACQAFVGDLLLASFGVAPP